MSIEDQYKEVRRVKKASNGLIEEPIKVQDTDTLEEVLKLCEKKRYTFRTFPVTDSNGNFVGVLTGDDFKYPDSLSVIVEKAMRPADQVVVAAVGTTLEDAYGIMQGHKINTLPLLDEAGVISGLYLFSDVSRNVRDAGSYNVDENRQLRVAAAISTGVHALERVEALSKYVDAVVIDTADGDSYYAFQTLKAVKAEFPEMEVVVGNISDGASARALAEVGANGIKVGQGPGSICTTRRETGIGMPQVTAVYESVRALGREYAHIPVCADGGIKDHGDIPIAFAAGASSVMMGRMLAGTDEAPGAVITRGDGTRIKVYRGMGSAGALQSNEASRERYEASGRLFLPEGVESFVPHEGSVEDVLGLCILALRKGMRYVKAPDLEYHRENTLLKRISGSGLRESHPHDVEVVKQ
jgi:IMP dehydrogenase